MEKYYVLERFALMKTAVITILKMHENCIRNLNRHENDYPIIF